LTVFEALGAARPIVATDADGLVEVLTPDVDALIVPKRDARALADRIIRLIDSPAERARLGAAARKTAEAYDITAFVRKMERLYDILHRDSRAMRRRVTTQVDLSFLTGKGV
jgi:glycosyltransferase involved in cell wall biosynthesis